jgi:adenylate kinase
LKVNDAAVLERAAIRVREMMAAGQTPRSDDEPETVKARQDVYYRDTAPLIAYYRNQGKLKTVDGMAPISDVTKNIAVALDG